VALHLVRAMLAAAFLYRFMAPERRQAYKRRWSRRLLDLLAVRLEAEETVTPPGLIVCNHVSWLDIFVIDALRPAAFVAMAEVRSWPLIGWLAGRNDTIFIDRDDRLQIARINERIVARLLSGFDVAIFPEGRTTDGARLLEFRTALLQPAVATGRPVLPMALSYHDADGSVSRAPSFAETSLARCFAAILACRSLAARLSPLPPLASAGRSRRVLARAARAAIATRLGLPPENRAPGTLPDPPA
jgi:1-acyl-sn-glycerol-3-phosphate acyltransferase